MRVVTKYISNDGREHASSADAYKHEEATLLKSLLKKAATETYDDSAFSYRSIDLSTAAINSLVYGIQRNNPKLVAKLIRALS